MFSFVFHKLQLIADLLLIGEFASLKLFVGFSIFDSDSFDLKFKWFCSTKSIDSLTLKRHNSFQNLNNKKATHILIPELLFLSFKIQYMCELELPKNWPRTEFLGTSVFLNSNF